MFNHHPKARELRLKYDMQLMKRCTKPVAEYAPTFKKICDQLLPLLKSLFETHSYNKKVALVEWLRCVLAKYLGFPCESSNLSGDENLFFGKFSICWSC